MVSGVVGIVKVFIHFVSKNFYRACSNDFFINLKKKPYNRPILAMHVSYILLFRYLSLDCRRWYESYEHDGTGPFSRRG